MGRSKFPGKPSKHILRKRINVLPPVAEISNVESSGSVTVETAVENNHGEDAVEGNSESSVIQNVNKKVSIKRRLTRKMKSLITSNKNQRTLLSRMCNKSSVKGKLNKGPRTTLNRKSVHNYTCRSKTSNEVTNLVGKFVLPTRSVHSSRVIKPNKRFISDMNEGLALKKKVTIAKRQCLKQEEEKSKLKSTETGSCNTESDKTTFTNGHRVVLRQARLKLPNMTGTQGPFSTKFNTTPSGTVTCGVCGAVRFYRFIKQARKFNIYSCESCRQFIAKMIKRQACGNQNVQTTLVCNKGQGSCQVSSIIRTQQWKLTKCAYRARCPACWLKMCLRAFQMPPSLKQSLSLMLPKNMQGLDVVYNNMMPSLLWQNNVEPKLVIDKPQETTIIKQRPLRFRNIKAPPAPSLPVSNVTNSDIKRQKIDLKGPRVKHVCRSASIVLGQPIATFSDGEKKCDIPNRTGSDVKTAEERTVVDKSVVESKCTVVNKCDVPFSENESNSIEKVSKTQSVLSELTESSTKRERSSRNSSISSQISETITTERKNNLIEPTHGIYVDFWEGYSDATNQNGFFLIGSEHFPIASVCFLCGSAGKESMIFCSLCCESYHRFCLDQNKSTILGLNRSNWKQYNWICPKCVSCDKCNQMDRQKITCQKCLKSFHPECLNLKWDRHNKQMVCSDCLKCRNCNADHATYSVGNLLLCEACFKQRRKGNACPICRHFYKENENNLKIMECTKCLKWTHPLCEKLSEEQYQIYSLLPETVQYVCSCCSEKSLHDWKRLINSELKSRLNDVLKLLTKNKAAKNLLNLGISNNYRDLDFDNNNYSRDIMYMNRIYSFDENEDSFMINTANTLSVIDIKNKLNTAEYNSVKKFNLDVEEYLKKFRSEQLLKIYQDIFQEQFPWYDKSLENELILLEDDNFETFAYCFNSGDVYDEILPVPSEDTRTCGLCKNTGDGDSCKESRLLYCGNNEWVHANCALWSSDVYEEIGGSLMNVHIALTKARLNRCTVCKQKGATMGCSYKGCHETYHFNCGLEAKLNFLYDKTVYCPSHELTRKSQIITDDKYFLVQRSLFVEQQDIKNRKLVDKDSVNCMIGSLHIKNVGKIDPIASDHTDALIPMGFMCSRLFWSTVEPWKLVPYTVSTSLLNPNNSMLAVDRNFTINHTLSKYDVDKMIREVNTWQRELEKKLSDTESEDDEEQQNGTELLSPELTDAILEELPHDLLDGISVQDIFPKFSYDDLISSIDCRSDIDSITDGFKRSEFEEELDQDSKCGKDQKRNKSDFYSSKIETITKSRQTQRSCGLALNYKIDSAISPVKKRKIGVGRENNLSIYQLLQVDGNCDDTSSSECGSPTGQTEDLSWETYVSEEPVTCEKCRCTYRTQASYKRHLDSCEVLCTSESDSEMVTDHELVTYVNSANSLDNPTAEPVVISSYQSYQSEIHTSVLNAQSFISSKQTSELLGTSPNNELVIQPPIQQVMEQKPLLQTVAVNAIAPETTHSEPSYSVNQPTITITDSAISIATNQPQFCVNQSMPLCVNQPISLSQNTIQMNPTTTFDGNQLLSINPSGSISINPINHSTNSISVNQPVQQSLDFQSPSVTIQSVPINNINNTILNVTPQNTFSLGGKVITNPVIQAVNMPNTHWVKQVGKPTIVTQKNVKARARGRTIAAKRTNHFEDGNTIILPAQNSAGQIIVQQIPSTNYVQTFVDAFHQPSQNVQYVATITPQTVPAQSLVQIQPDNNIISIVPGLPQTMYIQQPRVVENQLVLDSNSALGWSQQQTVQPVYYGFETIVQNTVMQSQQFLPTTVPGVLTANSSYSTTTQVFQTSKLEPVLDVASNSFVLVNPNQISQPMVNSQPVVNSQTLVNPQQIVNPQNIVNAQQIVNPSTIINTQPIVNSQALVNTQPLINTQSIVTTQPVVNAQSIVNAQPIVNAQSLVNNQPMLNSQALVNSHSLHTQPVITSQSLMNPQVVVTSQPATQTIVNTHPMVTTQPVINAAPDMSTQSLEQFHYTQAHNTHQIQNNIKSPQMQLGIKTSPKIEVKPSHSYIEVKISQPNIEVKPLQKNIDSRPQIHYEIKVPHQQYETKHTHTKYSTSTASQNKPMAQISHSITLPTTPFVPEQGIPTNIVTPIPKPPTSTQNRPMNRVLPMPTINAIKDTRKAIEDDEKAFLMDKHKISSHIFAEEIKRPPMRHISKANTMKEIEVRKLELSDPNILKTVFTAPIKPALTPPIKPALTPPIKPALTPPIKPSVTPPIKPSQPQVEPTTLLKGSKPADGNLLSPVNQHIKSPGLLSPLNQPNKSPGLLSPLNQPMKSSGLLSPLNQPTKSPSSPLSVNQPMKSPVVSQVKQPMVSPGLQSPMNQPIIPPGLQSQMNQPIISPGLQSPRNHSVISPGLQSPRNHPVISPGLQSPRNHPVISPGLQSPLNQPVILPGLQSPMNDPVILPGLQSPINQPVILPGLQSPMNQPIISTGLQSQMNQPIISPGMRSPVNQPALQSPMRQPIIPSGLQPTVNQSIVMSPGLQSPMNSPIISADLHCTINQSLKSPGLLSSVNTHTSSPGLLSPVTQPVKYAVLLSPTNQRSPEFSNVVPSETMPSTSVRSTTSPVPDIKSPTMFTVPAVQQPTRTEIEPDKSVTPPKRLKESKKEQKLVVQQETVYKIQKPENISMDKVPSKDKEVEKVVELSIPDDPKVDTSLKLVFQKQGQDGTYKVSNTFTSRPPVQVAPLKPIKSQNTVLNSKPATITRNNSTERLKCEERTDKREPESTRHQPKKDSESILYTIETQEGFKYSSTSISDLWSKVIQTVQSARAAHNMPLLPLKGNSVMNSVQVLGLKSNGLKYLIEQLPGATKCSKYKSKYKFPPHPSEVDDEFTPDHHLYDTIRCAPYENKRTEPYDMFGWLASKHRQPAEVSLDTLELLPRRVNNLPMAMKFRQLKLTSKYSLGVYRSLIHGRGLFCLRDIEAGEMVIEYAGEVIRSILTDKREKYYNSKGIGCYMFRVDDNFVVDATMKGNAARFINHSCDPNCYSRVVEIHGHKHIIIFALRRILSGEELTYDYKFPFEEDKIPCTCGSRKCRKFLN